MRSFGAVLMALIGAACSTDAPASEQPATGTSSAAAATGSSASPNDTRIVLGGVNLTGVGYDIGDPAAPITMVEFSDFGCPYCAQHALETLPAIQREFVDSGKVFYKHVPFVMGMFPNGELAARAAECAGEQDRFWPMHDSVYAHQSEWKRGREPDVVLTTLARQVVPDVDSWSACYASDRQGARTRAANAAAQGLSVRATPTFFINGQLVEGALPLGVMRGGLNSLLRESER